MDNKKKIIIGASVAVALVIIVLVILLVYFLYFVPRQVLINTDLNGINYHIFPATQASCQQGCLSDSNCKGWSYGTLALANSEPSVVGRCYFKNGKLNKTAHFGLNSGLVRG